MRKLLKKQKDKGKPKKQRQSFKLQRKKDRPVQPKIVPVRRLLRDIIQLFKKDWKIFVGLGVIYALSYRVLVEGLNRLNLNDMKDAMGNSGDATERFFDTIILTSTAFNASSESSSEQGPILAGVLSLLIVLCTIWATRYVMANEKIRIRDALYNGPAPTISTLGVLLVISLQILPMTMGLLFYGVATGNNFAQGGVENFLLVLVTLLLSVLTCYWLSSSLIALVAVTLPGMYPLTALRAAKKLVQYRRWQIFMRIAIFALVTGIFWLLVIVIGVSNPITRAVFTEILDLLRGATIVISTVFMYKLYRSLVDEQAE